jgi:2-amino-4-hydroxy-6-hydroxymethyldihydropteridine diphosphokinase
VAAGSNVAPVANLRRALDGLAAVFPALRVSPAYRNRAVGFDGEDFVNLVVELQTDLALPAVLERLHAIEESCGRARHAPKWAPRSMDLDVLLFGDAVIDEPGIKVPRPDLVRRAYMLKPAADLAPDVRHPTLGRTLGELWQSFDSASHPMTAVDLGWRA